MIRNARSVFFTALLAMSACKTSSSATSGDDVSDNKNLVTRAEPGLQGESSMPALPGAPRAFQKHAPSMVVSLADPKDPTVNFRLVFRTGSVDDPAGKEGLTDLTASLMAEGGTTSLTSAQLLEALYPMAAELSASTSKELTVFEGRVHRDHLPTFLTIFTDVLLAPRWDAKEFSRLQQDAINTVEKSLRSEDDEVLGKVALDALMYQGHPYGHFTGGTAKGLRAITLEDVKAHAKAVFTQDRLIIGLAGASNPELEHKVLASLARLPPTGKPAVELPAPKDSAQSAVLLQKDSLSTAISLGMPYSLRRGDPDYFKVAFGLSHLGEHRQFNGVLFTELREKRGLNYGDYAYAEHFAQEGGSSLPQTNVARRQQSFSIWIRPVEGENALFATRGALHFLQDLLDHGIPEEAFDRNRGFLTGYTRLWEQTAQRRLGYAIDGVLYGTPDFLDAYRKAMKSMTPEEVRQALRRHISLAQLRFALVAKDAQALGEALPNPPSSPHRYKKDGKLVDGYATQKDEALLEVDEKISTQPIPVSKGRVGVRPATTFMETAP